jgi:predicted RNase H-like HicB family nuclease
MNYTEIVWLDEEGDFIAKVAELPGCVAHGKTRYEALESLREIKEMWLEDARCFGTKGQLKDETPQI